MEDIYTDTLRGILADHCGLDVVRDIEAGRPAEPLWQAIENSGFSDVLVPEAEGGAGLGLADAFALLELCGIFIVPFPLAETMLARALLARAGLPRPSGSIALATARRLADGGWICDAVSCGRTAAWVLVDTGGTDALLLPADAATCGEAVGKLDASMTWSAQAQRAAMTVRIATDIRTWQACLTAVQLAGALGEVFTRTLAFANERQQFGRPIGKFQAIQHQLSVMAEHVCAARMAAQLGCSGPAPDRLRVAIAKARTGEAALAVAALSHAIHGAIGFTAEFDLQMFTRRLHAWRQTAGSEGYWQDVLGSALLAHAGHLTLDLLRATTDVALTPTKEHA